MHAADAATPENANKFATLGLNSFFCWPNNWHLQHCQMQKDARSWCSNARICKTVQVIIIELIIGICNSARCERNACRLCSRARRCKKVQVILLHLLLWPFTVQLKLWAVSFIMSGWSNGVPVFNMFLNCKSFYGPVAWMNLLWMGIVADTNWGYWTK